MPLSTNKQLMRIVPMPKTAFQRLIDYLEAIKPLHPELEPYLAAVMISRICLATHDIHLQEDVIDKAYFMVSGFMMAYYLDEAGNEHVLKIYRAGEIVAGSSFMNAWPSRYYLRIYRDTLVMEITYGQMQTGYQTIPDMEELARLTFAGFENKELLRDKMIRKGGEESVLHFYRANPELLPPGKIIKDHHIGSYLHMSVDNLQHTRTFLIKKGLLPNKKS